MQSLTEIADRFGTDKGTAGHRYSNFYERLFHPFRSRWIDVLEVGAQFGLSLMTWRDYFPNGHVTGVDLVDNGLAFRIDERIKLAVGDAYTLEMIERLKGGYDIIIDDGDHSLEHQKWFVEHYPALLESDGLMIVEDVLGLDNANEIARACPSHLHKAIVDLRQESDQPDNILVMVWP